MRKMCCWISSLSVYTQCKAPFVKLTLGYSGESSRVHNTVDLSIKPCFCVALELPGEWTEECMNELHLQVCKLCATEAASLKTLTLEIFTIALLLICLVILLLREAISSCHSAVIVHNNLESKIYSFLLLFRITFIQKSIGIPWKTS